MLHSAHRLEHRACTGGRSREAAHGSRPVGFTAENGTAYIAVLAQGEKKTSCSPAHGAILGKLGCAHNYSISRDLLSAYFQGDHSR